MGAALQQATLSIRAAAEMDMALQHPRLADVDRAEEAIDTADTWRIVVSAALSYTQGVLRVGKALPLIGPTCAVVSGCA